MASPDTFLATALMVAAEAEVVAAVDMEVATVNATDAEIPDTSQEIAPTLTAEVVVAAAVVTMMRPTTDKQKKQNIFSLCVEMSCNLQTGGFFIFMCRFEFRITNVITRW